MTVDEARAHLGITAAATVDEIRDAFRRRARALHPDLHPDADHADRARLGREFHNAREARDILVRYVSGPAAEARARALRAEANSPLDGSAHCSAYAERVQAIHAASTSDDALR